MNIINNRIISVSVPIVGICVLYLLGGLGLAYDESIVLLCDYSLWYTFTVITSLDLFLLCVCS